MEKLTSKQRHSYCDFEIWQYPDDDYPDTKHYYYKILENDGMQQYWIGCPVIRESDEYYDSEEEAQIAAIDHIDLLESGEG